MHNLQKWQLSARPLTQYCQTVCIQLIYHRVTTVLVFSILIFNCLYSITVLGRRFHNAKLFKLQVFIVLCVCYSTIILSWGVKTAESNTVRSLLVSGLRAYSAHFETRVILADCSCPLPLGGGWQQACPPPRYPPPSLFCMCWRSFIKCIPLLWCGHIGVFSVCEIMLSSGQEKNNMCDNSQANIHGSVSVLWTKAGWAELASGGVDEAGVGCCSVVSISIRLRCSRWVSGGSTVT